MLKQKSAIVTGSTSGIGLGIARALAHHGSDILLNGFGNAAEIEFTRAELVRQYAVKVRYSGADMSQPDQVRAMAALAQTEFDKIDIIVNNAGIQHVDPIEALADDKWDAVLAINLSSAFHLIKAVTPGMKSRRFGRIINIASAHGLTASPFKSAYIADQAKVHGISPEQVVREVMLSQQARKVFVQVEELAALAVFLASGAAASLTGTALAMDGGWTLH